LYFCNRNRCMHWLFVILVFTAKSKPSNTLPCTTINDKDLCYGNVKCFWHHSKAQCEILDERDCAALGSPIFCQEDAECRWFNGECTQKEATSTPCRGNTHKLSCFENPHCFWDPTNSRCSNLEHRMNYLHASAYPDNQTPPTRTPSLHPSSSNPTFHPSKIPSHKPTHYPTSTTPRPTSTTTTTTTRPIIHTTPYQPPPRPPPRPPPFWSTTTTQPYTTSTFYGLITHDLPPPPPKGENCHMVPGDVVVLQNLPNPTFNGRTARLKYWDSRARMWNVEMPSGVQFNIFQSNMVMPCQSSRPTSTTTAPRTTSAAHQRAECEFEPGNSVVLQNLPNPAFNGQTVLLDSWNAQKGMWKITMANGQQFEIKLEDMKHPKSCETNSETESTHSGDLNEWSSNDYSGWKDCEDILKRQECEKTIFMGLPCSWRQNACNENDCESIWKKEVCEKYPVCAWDVIDKKCNDRVDIGVYGSVSPGAQTTLSSIRKLEDDSRSQPIWLLLFLSCIMSCLCTVLLLRCAYGKPRSNRAEYPLL